MDASAASRRLTVRCSSGYQSGRLGVDVRRATGLLDEVDAGNRVAVGAAIGALLADAARR